MALTLQDWQVSSLWLCTWTCQWRDEQCPYVPFFGTCLQGGKFFSANSPLKIYHDQNDPRGRKFVFLPKSWLEKGRERWEKLRRCGWLVCELTPAVWWSWLPASLELVFFGAKMVQAMACLSPDHCEVTNNPLKILKGHLTIPKR